MTLKKRLEALESRQSPLHTTELTGSAAVVREIDKLIARHDGHLRELAQRPETYTEGFDLALYGGESITDHEARVHSLERQYHEEHEAWGRTHRPDLVGVPNEIDDHIAELDKEIALLELEIATESGANEGGGG